jgi:hypothetical protein
MDYTHGYGEGNQVHWKVGNPTVSNDIVPMASFGAQPRFYLGGSQIPNTLGIKGNSSGNAFKSKSLIDKKSKSRKVKL